MPRNITVTFDDGSTHVYQNAPDDITPDMVSARAQQDFGKSVTALDGGRAAMPSAPVAAPAQASAPEKRYSLENNILGAVSEPVTVAATGMVGSVAGGLAGIGQGLKNLVSPGMPAADRVAQVQSALTYQPRTAAGKAVTSAIGVPMSYIERGTDAVGGGVAKLTGSPAVGAATKAGLEFAPALLLRGRVGRGSPSPNRAGAPVEAPKARPANPAQAERPAGLARVSEKPPTIEELNAAKNAAYKKADETGIVISRGAMNRLKVQLVNDLKKEGLDKTLHPKTSAALSRILEKKGQLTLTEMETLRKIAGDAAGAIEKADARLGRKIIEHIDDFEEGLGASDVISGNPAAATSFKDARALNARLSKAKTIQKLFDDAELQAGANYTVSGMENSLRQQFKALAKNEKRMRGFSPEEVAAIRKVALGGPVENALRLVGKFAPNGTVSSLAGMGSVMVAGPAGMIVPAAGVASKYAATKMTMRNAGKVSDMVRSGRPLTRQAARNALAEMQ